MFEVIPNFQKNAAEIVAYARQPHISAKFRPREGSLSHAGFNKHNSQFCSLLNEDMPSELIKMIFDGGDWHEDLRDFYQFIQIQRYMPGDYIVPHIDKYNIRKLHLVCLTTSDRDAFFTFEDDKMVRADDQAGAKIEFTYDAIHFVPTCTYERYSLVIAE
jgi:hypothetical protein